MPSRLSPLAGEFVALLDADGRHRPRPVSWSGPGISRLSLMRCAPDNWLFWISLSLAMKLALFLFFLKFFTPAQPADLVGFWGATTNDTVGYLQPIEEALSFRDPLRVFDDRMFGYGLPYLAFRWFLAKPAALNAVIVAQLLISSLSVYLLALLALRLFGSLRSFLFTFFGYFMVPIVSYYDVVALTESFSTSALILGVHFLFTSRSRRQLALSGACLTWCVFLRPVFMPVVALCLLYILVDVHRVEYKKPLSCAILFLAPLILAESVWIVGRYEKGATSDFVVPPALASLYLDEAKHSLALIGFLNAIGEDWQVNPWFYSRPIAPGVNCIVETSRFDCRDIENLQRRALRAQSDFVTFNPDTPPSEAFAQNRIINEELKAYTRSVREERPVYYYIVAPAKYLLRLLFASSTYRMFGEYATMTKLWLPFRLGIDSMTWVLQLSLPAAVLWGCSRSAETGKLALVAGIVGYFYFVHALLFRMSDFRYVIPVLPLLVMITVSFASGVLVERMWPKPTERPERSLRGQQ